MKINNQIGPLGVNPYKRSQEQSAAASKSGSSKQDKLEISAKALDLQQAKGSSAARQEKVEQLKNQLESGNYTVDVKAVAESIYQYYKQ